MLTDTLRLGSGPAEVEERTAVPRGPFRICDRSGSGAASDGHVTDLPADPHGGERHGADPSDDPTAELGAGRVEGDIDARDEVVLDKDPVPTWDEVATRYGGKIYSIAYRLTGDAEEARDLTQDVFVRVYRKLDTYEPGTFEGWLYRVTKNLFLDRVRRRKRAVIEPLPDEEWRQPEDEGPGPEQRLEQGLLRGDIEAALTKLPADFRTAVVLCDVQGLSYEEIAGATGWPLGTVRSRIHRGRKLLRSHLGASGVDVRHA